MRSLSGWAVMTACKVVYSCNSLPTRKHSASTGISMVYIYTAANKYMSAPRVRGVVEIYSWLSPSLPQPSRL